MSTLIEFDVPQGQGVIEVIGDSDASMLLLAAEAVSICGFVGSGSFQFLASRAGGGVVGAAEVKALVEWLADPGLKNETALLDPDCLSPLLKLLSSGRYTLATRILREPFVVVDRTTLWYDEVTALVPTDSWPPPDSAQVWHYRARIGGRCRGRRRHRPAVVALGPTRGSQVWYLLDGHHKLAAYLAEGVAPLVIQLAPCRPVPPRPADLARVEAALETAFTAPGGPPRGGPRPKPQQILIYPPDDPAELRELLWDMSRTWRYSVRIPSSIDG